MFRWLGGFPGNKERKKRMDITVHFPPPLILFVGATADGFGLPVLSCTVHIFVTL